MMKKSKASPFRYAAACGGMLLLFWAVPLLASDEGIPLNLPKAEICNTCADESAHKEVPRITIQELKKKMDSGEDVVIVDVQPGAVYESGHIRGALSLPWAPKLKESDVRQLPRDKTIILYCDCGPGEADSSDVAAQLQGMGFGSIVVLADPSIRGWIRAGYPVEK